MSGVIILSGKTSGFIAGADIEQFVALEDQKQAFDLIHQAQQVFNKLANLKIPTALSAASTLRYRKPPSHRMGRDTAARPAVQPDAR